MYIPLLREGVSIWGGAHILMMPALAKHKQKENKMNDIKRKELSAELQNWCEERDQLEYDISEDEKVKVGLVDAPFAFKHQHESFLSDAAWNKRRLVLVQKEISAITYVLNRG